MISRLMSQPCDTSAILFRRRHFDREIIILCVRWYLTYKLSYRDLRAMMAERGIDLAHTTIMRWVQRYVPEFEKRWQQYAQPVGTSWRVDETYIKIRGKWSYLYRSVDKEGHTVDFLLSEHRDIAAAKRFFERAVTKHGVPPEDHARWIRGFPCSGCRVTRREHFASCSHGTNEPLSEQCN